MENFEFHNPTKIVFGKGTISKIGTEISNHGSKKILFLYGKSSIFKNGVYDEVTSSLKEKGILSVELGGVKPNPVLSKVHEAIELCKKEKVDGILAVGGGSVIDSAKVIAAGVFYDGDIWDAFEGKGRAGKSLPIFTVLTLSATGSEMNPYAVITKEDEDKKWAFSAGVHSYPKVTIIDPSVQMFLPKEQTVNGAVDALSHIFELYFDGADNNDVLDEISEGLIRTVMKHTEVLLKNPDNYESRAQLAWCATLALNGMNSTGRFGGDWATHGMEHSLSAFYDVAHGAGLAIMFPAWMTYVYKYKIDKFVRFAETVFNVKSGSKEERVLSAIEKLKEFYKKIGAPVSLRSINIQETEINRLTQNAFMRGSIGKLVKLNEDDINKIFKLAY